MSLLLTAYYETARYFEWSSGASASPSIEGVDVDIDADESDLLDDGDGGEAACDECISLDGFYDAEPVRPHTGCDCQIVEHFNLDIDWQEIVKNPQTTVGSIDEQLLERVTINNGGSEPMEGDYSESHTVEGSIEVSATVEEFFEVSSSYSESLTQEVAFHYTVPAHSDGELEVYGQTQEVTFAGELWLVDPDTGNEVYVEDFTETIETAYGIRAEYTAGDDGEAVDGED